LAFQAGINNDKVASMDARDYLVKTAHIPLVIFENLEDTPHTPPCKHMLPAEEKLNLNQLDNMLKQFFTVL
jgi:hypothetical protein